jgi:hypothetical protein
MFARRVSKAVPIQAENVGFDLFVGDYVAPYGRGNTSDLIFRLRNNERAPDNYDYELTVAFSRKLDGILPFKAISHLQGSAFRSPYSAPDVGLLSTWAVSKIRSSDGPERNNYDPENHAYFFRVRTILDSKGEIVSANYGKIYGDFMNFTYYLNPKPNDRNIEFEPRRNLFTDLKPVERVIDP